MLRWLGCQDSGQQERPSWENLSAVNVLFFPPLLPCSLPPSFLHLSSLSFLPFSFSSWSVKAFLSFQITDAKYRFMFHASSTLLRYDINAVTDMTEQGFLGGSDGKESARNAGDLGSIPGLGRSPGEGHGNPLQCSCLENPHGQRSLEGCSPWGRKSRTRLCDEAQHIQRLNGNKIH